MIGEPVSDSQEDIERLTRKQHKAGQSGQTEVEAAVEPITTAKPRIYVVQQGDSLSQIAKNVYGEAARWREIYEANKHKIKDPKIIQPGQELEIP